MQEEEVAAGNEPEGGRSMRRRIRCSLRLPGHPLQMRGKRRRNSESSDQWHGANPRSRPPCAILPRRGNLLVPSELCRRTSRCVPVCACVAFAREGAEAERRRKAREWLDRTRTRAI